MQSRQGYTCGTDLFGFGYDFRQSNSAHVPALLDRLRSMHALTGRRADILSHSMGALVVRSLLIDHAEEFERLVSPGIAVLAGRGGLGIQASASHAGLPQMRGCPAPPAPGRTRHIFCAGNHA